jgi:hypothetical protein
VEGDGDRLEHYRDDVIAIAPALVRRSTPETAAVVIEVVAQRFRSDVILPA